MVDQITDRKHSSLGWIDRIVKMRNGRVSQGANVANNCTRVLASHTRSEDGNSLLNSREQTHSRSDTSTPTIGKKGQFIDQPWCECQVQTIRKLASLSSHYHAGENDWPMEILRYFGKRVPYLYDFGSEHCPRNEGFGLLRLPAPCGVPQRNADRHNSRTHGAYCSKDVPEVFVRIEVPSCCKRQASDEPTEHCCDHEAFGFTDSHLTPNFFAGIVA